MVGGVGNRAAEEDWRWDLNPGTAAMTRRTTRLWGSLCHAVEEARRQDVAAMQSSLSSLEECRRDTGKERGERTLAAGP